MTELACLQPHKYEWPQISMEIYFDPAEPSELRPCDIAITVSACFAVLELQLGPDNHVSIYGLLLQRGKRRNTRVRTECWSVLRTPVQSLDIFHQRKEPKLQTLIPVASQIHDHHGLIIHSIARVVSERREERAGLSVAGARDTKIFKWRMRYLEKHNAHSAILHVRCIQAKTCRV